MFAVYFGIASLVRAYISGFAAVAICFEAHKTSKISTNNDSVQACTRNQLAGT